MLRTVMSLPSGRVAKWVVLALWVALLIPAVMLAGKLGGVEKNDSSAWLPSNAEADAAAFTAIKDVVGQPQGTLKAQDGMAIQTVVQVHYGAAGWNGVRKV